MNEEHSTVRPVNAIPRHILEANKREEITNDIEIELVQCFIDDIKCHLGKPGLLSKYVWRHLKNTIEREGPNYKRLAQKVMRNIEWRKLLAINKANEETDSEKKAVVFVQYAMRIINVFDYICPIHITKSDFYDIDQEQIYIQLAQRELNIKNEEDALLRHKILSSLDYKVGPAGFVSPAHSSQSDIKSIRMKQNLDRAENGSFYPDDESNNESFLSIHDV